MSASIPSLLADKLDVSDQKAKKLLIAMLREVKKRAFREGVRLPEFGTFRENNGQLTFEPSSSLARAVNQQFEGLESENLATAPDRESEEEESDDGPNTITLGYKDSDWSPLDSEEGADEEATSEDDDAADTAEFQVPSAEEAADTEELQAQGASAESRAEAADDEPQVQEVESSADSSTTDEPSAEPDRSQTQTEDLYPLVEDAPGSSEAEDDEPALDQQPVDEEERESLSDIWDSEEEDESAETAPPSDADWGPVPTSGSDSETEPVVDPEPASETPSSSPDDQPTSEVDFAPDSREARPEDEASEDEAESPKKEGSTGARVLVGVLVLLVLGGAGWYVLGQRGTVQTPRATFAQLKAQIQPHVKDLPLVGSTSFTPWSTSDAESPSTASAPAASDSPTEAQSTSSGGSQDSGAGPEDTPTSETGTDAPTTSTDETSAAAPTSSESSSSQETGSASSQALKPSEGGWTIIVSSQPKRDPAASLVQNYRRVFAAQNLPVGILTGKANGETRYRIGVGQFESRDKAQRFVEKAGKKLPKGAWVYPLK